MTFDRYLAEITSDQVNFGDQYQQYPYCDRTVSVLYCVGPRSYSKCVCDMILEFPGRVRPWPLPGTTYCVCNSTSEMRIMHVGGCAALCNGVSRAYQWLNSRASPPSACGSAIFNVMSRPCDALSLILELN